MGLTSALFAGLSGLKTNEFRMDVIGNNIANINTHSYKSQRTTFQTQFSQTLSFGSAPSGTIGGTNPLQVGTGSSVGGMNRDFSVGAPETTGIKTDLAIQGPGLFILSKGDGSRIYSRDGSFTFNAENDLVSSGGFFLMGYGVDTNFNIVEGLLTRLSIPVGEITTAATTTFAKFSGDLNAGGKDTTFLASQGLATRPVLTSQVFYSDVAAATAAVSGTALASLYVSDGSGGSIKLFETGNVITLSEANKGGADLEQEQFTVGATGSTTYGELVAWLEDVLGINTDSSLPDFTADGVSDPGTSVLTAGASIGAIEIVGNMGHKNNIILSSKAITVAQGTAGTVPLSTTPFLFSSNTSTATTDDQLKDILGESIRTSFRGFDSLGNTVNVNITMVMESKGAAGVRWRYYAESADDSDADRVLGTGTILFDPGGSYLNGTNLDISVDRVGTGASTPQSITLDFSGMNGFAMPSAISLLRQDGFQSGTLQDFSIGNDGVIVGSFDNGLTRNLGQVVLSTFRNYEGLVADGGNLYKGGPNSGDSLIKKPFELGAGSIQSGALELSNVDLSREFINLIISSTGFSASSRVIQTSNQLLDELIRMTR